MTRPLSLNDQLANAAAALVRATDAHMLARGVTAKARKVEEDALNRVNEAQATIDHLVAVLKKDSPRESDWNLRS